MASMSLSLLFVVLCISLLSVHSFTATLKAQPTRAGRTLIMGNNAKFGIFSPAVIVARAVIGEQKLNKLRGKAISLHSQAITEWCVQYGAYGLRLKLIKRAKKNGDELGFLI